MDKNQTILEQRSESTPKAYLNPDDIVKLEEAADNLRDKLLIRVLFHLGCRVSEALGITTDDIDFLAGTIRIQHLKARISLACEACGARLGKSHTYCPKCGKAVKDAVKKALEHCRMRTIPLDNKTMEILKEYVNRGGPVKADNKTLIFGINRHRAWQIIKKAADRADLPHLVNSETGKVHYVSPHKLRDAFAVNAVKHNDTGDGLRLLQEHLGHASFNTTAKYRKVGGEELKTWYGALWQPVTGNTKGNTR